MRSGFKLVYCKVNERRKGVEIILKERSIKVDQQVKNVLDRIVNSKIEVVGAMLNAMQKMKKPQTLMIQPLRHRNVWGINPYTPGFFVSRYFPYGSF